MGGWATILDRIPTTPGSIGISQDKVDWTIWFLEPVEKADGSTTISLTHTQHADWQTRVVAIDDKNQEHVSSQDGSSSGPGETVQLMSVFPNLSLKRIKQFRFQMRRVHWVEFRNIALRPNFPAAISAPAETPGNAASVSSNVPWGDWNAGWSVRLRADKSVWTSEEEPQFTVDLRKREKGEPDAKRPSLHNWVLDVDGRRFRLGLFSTSWEPKQLFELGTTREDFIVFRFCRDQKRGLEVHTIKNGAVVNFYSLDPIGKDGHVLSHPKPENRFEWLPGKHVVRIAFPNTPAPKDWKDDYVLSNPAMVQIEGKPAAANKQQADFGPVIEQVVRDWSESLVDSVIDFDSGKLFSTPKELPLKPGESPASKKQAGEAWVRANGIDACGGVRLLKVLQPAKEVPPRSDAAQPFVLSVHVGLEGLDMFATPTANDGWDHLTRVDIQSRMAQAKLDNRRLPKLKDDMSTSGQFPATFLFETREGGMGILQIVGFTEKPKGVRIRYKLLRDSAAPSAAADNDKDVARLRLESAERMFKIVEARYKRGTVTAEEFYKAELARDLAEANVKGDAVAAARARLHYAEQQFHWIEMRHKVGMATAEAFETARLARDVAKGEVAKLAKTDQAKAGYTKDAKDTKDAKSKAGTPEPVPSARSDSAGAKKQREGRGT